MSTRLPSGSPRLLRRLNSAAVLHAIRAQGPTSRAELARVTGLSKPTVNEVVEFLLGAGYVTESMPGGDGEGQPRRPGRRARMLRFRSDLGHVLGIDIGANKTLALVTDLDGLVLATERRRTSGQERARPEAMLAKVRVVARAALEAAGIEAAQLEAVGVGTPGIVGPAGEVTLAPQLGGWEGIQLGRRLGRSFPCPVLVDNEVHLSVLAERWRGAAQDVNDAFYVQLGVGIGGGILIGGDVYRGASGAAGEVGYLPLFDGELPREGLGAFEHAAGGGAFARLGRRAAAADATSALRELSGGRLDSIDAETVFAAAERDDRAAAEVLDELLERLARGIAAAVVVLNPATVIVGGGISRAGERLLEPLERRIRELVPVPPQLVLSTLGDEAVALGAARLALQVVEERLFGLSVG
jgi:predicted NBD/HSP70 family sugar kinase